MLLSFMAFLTISSNTPIFGPASCSRFFEDDPHTFILSNSQVEWLQEDGETLVPVHRGNLVKPGECTKAPEVSFKVAFSSYRVILW